MPYTSILKTLFRNNNQSGDLPAEGTIANNKAERQSLYRGRFLSKFGKPPAINLKAKARFNEVSSEVSQLSPQDIKVEGKTVVELEDDKDYMKHFEASCIELEKRHGRKGGNTTIVHIPKTVMESIRRIDSGSPTTSTQKQKEKIVVEMPEHPTPERIKWERQVRKFKLQLPRFGDSEPLERFKGREIGNASSSISQQEQQQNSLTQEIENETQVVQPLEIPVQDVENPSNSNSNSNSQIEQLPSTENISDDPSSTRETQAEFRTRFEALGPKGRSTLFCKHKKKQSVLNKKTLVFNASSHILGHKEMSCTNLYKGNKKLGGLIGGHNRWNTSRPILPSPLQQSITGMKSSALVSAQLSNHNHENKNENEDKTLLLRLCFCGACGDWELKKLSREVISTFSKCSTCSKDQLFDVPSNETDEENSPQQLYSTSTATRLRSSSFGRKISTSPTFLPSPEEKLEAIEVANKQYKKYNKREKREKKRERKNEGELSSICGGNKDKENQCWYLGDDIQKSVAARQADDLARSGELTLGGWKLKDEREKLIAMLKSGIPSGSGSA